MASPDGARDIVSLMMDMRSSSRVASRTKTELMSNTISPPVSFVDWIASGYVFSTGLKMAESPLGDTNSAMLMSNVPNTCGCTCVST